MLNLNILDDIMESDAGQRVGKTASKVLDLGDVVCEAGIELGIAIRDNLKSYNKDLKIKLEYQDTDEYVEKKRKEIILEVDEAIEHSVSRIERRRVRRTKGVNNDAQ